MQHTCSYWSHRRDIHVATGHIMLGSRVTVVSQAKQAIDFALADADR